MKKYRVIQWATGAVGSAALREIIRHPKLELVGVKVYYDHKDGRDAGDIVNMGKTGVIATKDVDAIMALDALPHLKSYRLGFFINVHALGQPWHQFLFFIILNYFFHPAQQHIQIHGPLLNGTSQNPRAGTGN